MGDSSIVTDGEGEMPALGEPLASQAERTDGLARKVPVDLPPSREIGRGGSEVLVEQEVGSGWTLGSQTSPQGWPAGRWELCGKC